LADGDLETLGGEGRTQCARHGFSVAKVAHIIILRLNETGAPGLALLTRSFGQRDVKGRDAFTVPRGAQAAGRIYREKSGLEMV
jgi:hypothetical protein